MDKTNFMHPHLTKEVLDQHGNKTVYEYNSTGKIIKMTNKKRAWKNLSNIAFVYDRDENLTAIARGDGVRYAFTHDSLGRLTSISEDTAKRTLTKYSYKDDRDYPVSVIYANGNILQGIYNDCGQPTEEVWFDDETCTIPSAHYKYCYDRQGNITSVADLILKKEFYYTYESEKLIRSTEHNIILDEAGTIMERIAVNTTSYTYNSAGELIKKHITPINGPEQTLYFGNAIDMEITVKNELDTQTVSFRTTADHNGNELYETYQVNMNPEFRTIQNVDSVSETSSEPKSIDRVFFSDGKKMIYKKNDDNRIASVVNIKNETVNYVYDTLGQLLLEIRNGETVNNMEYDNYGNIVKKNGVAYTYNPRRKDLLTSIGGKKICYDAQGNPIIYLGHKLTWERGQLLNSFDGISYRYNNKGIRTEKNENGTKHQYILDGDQIIQEIRGDHILSPLYNKEEISGILYDSEIYLFLKDLQGNITEITNSTGETVALYDYNAWGICEIISDSTDCNIAEINPFRYRGYYYDSEIKMYYIQGRYYDPAVARFISPNDPTTLQFIGTTLDYNLYTYCKNDPINRELFE